MSVCVCVCKILVLSLYYDKLSTVRIAFSWHVCLKDFGQNVESCFLSIIKKEN